MEGTSEWCLPPDGAILPGGTKDAGDGKASRTPFGGDGKLVLSFPPGVGEDIERVVGIIVRNNADWLHADVGDLAVPLKTPSSSGVLKALSIAENMSKQENGINLFERFCRINDKLSESQQAGPAGAAAIFASTCCAFPKSDTHCVLPKLVTVRTDYSDCLLIHITKD